jgi:hypothetical protein
MKLVLLGTADSIAQAPYGDHSWTIWGCQPVLTYPACKRVDRLFELHDGSYWRDPQIIERMNKANIPILMQRKFAEVPRSEEFPLREMIERYRDFLGGRYYTSTIAYMLAYALFRGESRVEEIALYGVHMAADEEYGAQRQSLEYWAGAANGMGVKVTVASQSSICSTKFLYGYDSESTMLTEMRKMAEEFNRNIAQAKAKVDADVQTLYEYGGALKMLAKIRRLYS